MKKASTKLLMAIGEAQLKEGNETPYVMASKTEAAELLTGNAPLAEFNDEISDGDKIAFRLTPRGLETYEAEKAKGGTAANLDPTKVAENATAFTIEYGEAAPAPSRRGRGAAQIYPFDALPAPTEDGKQASFFVPAEAEEGQTPEAAGKKVASRLAAAASSANKRYGKLNPARTFRAVNSKSTDGKSIVGVRVYRTA